MCDALIYTITFTHTHTHTTRAILPVAASPAVRRGEVGGWLGAAHLLILFCSHANAQLLLLFCVFCVVVAEALDFLLTFTKRLTDKSAFVCEVHCCVRASVCGERNEWTAVAVVWVG